MTRETIEERERIRLAALCDAGAFLQVQASVADLPPPAHWRGAESTLLAARLLYPLGAERLADAVARRGLRRHPRSIDLLERVVFAQIRRRGALSAKRMLAAAPTPSTVAEESTLCGVRAHGATELRDFDTADEALRRALELEPDSGWNHVIASAVRAAEDRYDEALAAARRAVALRPGMGAAISALAHLLQLREHDDEAIEVLQAGVARTEIAYLSVQLAGVLLEVERADEALVALDRAAACAPLAESVFQEGIRSLRFSALYQQDRIDDARQVAAAMRSPFHQRQADRLATATDQPVLRCPVPFVRQHHLTCGPATLTALAMSFGASTDHLAVADAICWGGTRGYVERRWALQNGFAAREFTLTVPAARALLARGIPFAVATQEATSGHLQALMGHDPRRGVMLVRDPYFRHTREWLDEEFLERYRSSGPRAMAIVPAARAAELAERDLPDAELFDLLFQVQEALHAHDHAAARRVHAELVERAPDHALTIYSRWSLTDYEQDAVGALACIERMLALYPDDHGLLLRRVAALEALGRGTDSRAALESVVASQPSDPAFLVHLASVLARDPGQQPRRRELLRRLERYAAGHAGILRALASWHWDEQDQATAVELFRLAACADEVSESTAFASYFRAAHACGRQDEGLAFLRRRFERHGRKDAGPARSLFLALDLLGRTHEGLAVLDSALELRPDDPELLLFAADVFSANGRDEDARGLLQRARGRANVAEHAATAARLAERRGELAASLGHWREVVACEPLHWRAHDAITAALAATVGHAAAAEHMRGVVETFPFLSEPRRRLAIHHGAREPERAAEALRELLELEPDDAWARRELALRCVDLGQREQALAEVERACELEPRAAASHGIRAFVLTELGRRAEAATAALVALRLDPDYALCIEPAITHAATDAARLAAIDTVFELMSAGGTGAGVATLFRVASVHLPTPEVEWRLREFVTRRPAVWQARALLAAHELRSGRPAAARACAERLVADHPLLPVGWRTLAEACAKVGDAEAAGAACMRAIRLAPEDDAGWDLLGGLCGASVTAELARELVAERPQDAERWARVATMDLATGERLAALGRARDLRPTWSQPYDEAAALLGAEGRWEDARAWLATYPGDLPFNLRGRAAWLQHRAGDPDGAIAAMRGILAEVATYAWGWFQLCAWLEEREDWADLREAATRLAELSPDDPVPLAYLADAHLHTDEPAAADAALGRAVELAPGYRFALWKLVQRRLAAGEYDAAAEVVARAHARAPGATTTAAAVVVAAARGDEAAARRAFGELLAIDALEADDFAWPEEALRRAGMKAVAALGIEKAVAGARPQACVVRRWMEYATETGRWREAAEVVRRLVRHGVACEEAAFVLLERVGKVGRNEFDRLLRGPLRETLRSHDLLWGQVGYVLMVANRARAAAAWLADWRERKGFAPWMADNLVTALRALRRRALAVEVSDWVLAHAAGRDVALHAAWRAVDAASEGDDARARDLRARVSGDGFAASLAELVDAYCVLADGGFEAAADALVATVRTSRDKAEGLYLRAASAVTARLARGRGFAGWWLRVRVWTS